VAVFSRGKTCGSREETAGVAPFQSLLLQSPAALAPESEVAQEGLEGDNLYDSVDGHTYAVNVLPDGQLAEDAVLGGPAGEAHQRPDFDRVIAADGSRVFWTDLDTTVGPENPGGLTRLFAREDPTSSSATTVQVDALQSGPGNPGGGRFWTASADGTKVLFTDESKLTTDATAEPGMPNLYLYDFDKPLGSRLTDLTPAAGAAVQGVVGASSSGAYVYFVADGALAKNHNSEGAGAEPRTCEEAAGNLEPGTPSEEEALGHLPHGIGCNLYVWHEGDTEPTFIAALARKDDNLMVNRGAPIVATGDWQPELGSRTAQVTPNGGALVFESTQQLTGYDNSALVEDATHATTGLSNDIAKLAVEIFAYDAVSGPEGKLSCASCAPTGEPPAQEAHGAEAGTFLPTTENPTYMRRWISEDGSRVFFDSSQPLSSADSNHLQDVYEWERPAETGEADNGCTAQAVSPITGGCTSLLSGGQSSDSSFLIDADASGNNVFFAHRGQLAGIGASEGKMDVIDARVGGGFAESSEACTGTGCQGVPPGPPTFATPSTATFAGPGNFPPLTTVKKTTVKKTVKCKKGYVKNKKNKCVKKAKKKSKKAKKAGHGGRTKS
jgi:hypothetical protein